MRYNNNFYTDLQYQSDIIPLALQSTRRRALLMWKAPSPSEILDVSPGVYEQRPRAAVTRARLRSFAGGMVTPFVLPAC